MLPGRLSQKAEQGDKRSRTQTSKLGYKNILNCIQIESKTLKFDYPYGKNIHLYLIEQKTV